MTNSASSAIIDFDGERSRHAEVLGREDVLDWLRGWLVGDHPLACGWVLLLGSPGVGKSAILTKILDTLPGPTAPHHFIRRGIEGWDRPEVVVQNLCAQIERRFPDLASAAMPAEARLGELLKKLSKSELVPRGERLVLVIDGLDEIARDGSGRNPLPLFLPRALPRGVVILCASRPIYPHLEWLDQLDGVHRLKLDDQTWSASNEAACRAFWEHHARTFSPPLDLGFVDEAVRRAGGNLLHAIRLRDWLLDQPRERRVATNIPEGLSGFLTQIWTDLHALPGDQSLLVMKGLGIACAAREALPLYLFRHLLGWSTTGEDEAFLRATRPFLLEERAHWNCGQLAYRPYHECFRDFVAQHLGQDAIREHHRCLAETLAPWPIDGSDPARRTYALRHAVAHRIEAGDLHGAERLCADISYLEAKCRELGVPAIERDLEAVIRAPGEAPSFTPAAVLAAISAEASGIGADPSSLGTRLYNRLRCAGWSPERIEAELSFPQGPPPLRLLHGVRLGPAQLRTFTGHDRSVVACAVAPDGSRLVSASTDRTLRLWMLGSAECVAELRGHDDELTACVVTPDGRTAVSASADGTVRLWDLDSRRAIRTLDNRKRSATACAVTPDGQHLVVGSDNGDITVWRRWSGEYVGTLKGHDSYVTACLVTPSSQHIVSASRDQSVRVWELETFRCKHVLDRAKAVLQPTQVGAEEQSWITALSLLPWGGQIIAAAGDGSLMQWDLDSGCLVRSFGAGQGRVDSCALLHEGLHVLCGLTDGTIAVWDIAGQRQVLSMKAHAGAVSSCAATQDGRRFLSASYDRSIKLWDLGGPENLAAHDSHTAPVTACAITPDGRTAVSASEDRTLKVWDIATGTCKATLEGHAELVTACAISPDGGRVLSGARDGGVRVWNVDTGSGEDLEPHAAMVTGCAFSHDAGLITTSQDGLLRIQGTERPAALSEPDAPMDGCALTSNGAHALSFSRSGMVKLWHLASRSCGRNQRGLGAKLLACALTPDGQRAVLAREDGQIEVRDLRGQRTTRVFRGHSGRIFGCAIAPDGERVISASGDGTIRVYGLASGRWLGTLQGTSWFRCVAVTDGLICAGDQEGNLWMIKDDTGGQKSEVKTAMRSGPGAGDRASNHGQKIRHQVRSLQERGAAGERQQMQDQAPQQGFPIAHIAPLRNVLAFLYGSAAKAAIVAADAGLDITRLTLQGSAQDCWFEILVEAFHQDRLDELVCRVQQDFNGNRGLLKAARDLGINVEGE